MKSDSDTLSMKIVKNVLVSFKNKVVLGSGMMTSIVAMYEDKTIKNPKDRFKGLKVLLDSGSNGNLLFEHGKKLLFHVRKCLPHKNGELLVIRLKRNTT